MIARNQTGSAGNAGMAVVITRGPSGHRTGQSHGRAKLSDEQIERMRVLNELGWGYRVLAELFQCGISTARDICTYRTR